MTNYYECTKTANLFICEPNKGMLIDDQPHQISLHRRATTTYVHGMFLLHATVSSMSPRPKTLLILTFPVLSFTNATQTVSRVVSPREYATQTHLQHLAIVFSLPNYVFQPGKMAEQPVQCTDCPKLLTPQKTWSDRNGNQGRLHVSVSILCAPFFHRLFLSFSVQRNQEMTTHPVLLFC